MLSSTYKKVRLNIDEYIMYIMYKELRTIARIAEEMTPNY